MKARTYHGTACMAALALSLLAPACSEERVCTPDPGVICTLVGDGEPGTSDDGLRGVDTSLYLPIAATFGPDGQLYVSDWNNHRIRVLTAEGRVRTVAGTGRLGDGPDGPALAADFTHPSELLFDSQGRMIIAAWHNSRVKRLDLATGQLETIAGTGWRTYTGDGGPARDAAFDLPSGLAFDRDGNLLVLDQVNQVIRRIDASGIIETIAGKCITDECAPGQEPALCPDGSSKTACGLADTPDVCLYPCQPGFAGDGGPATELRMAQPFGAQAPPSGRMEVDARGTIYFADTSNHRIRRIEAVSGVVTTMAGNGVKGFAGDGGPAVDAELHSPADVALARDGTLYIADTQNSCVRAVSPDGVINTVAGICGQRGFDGDGRDPRATLLNRPYGIALDQDDNLYVVDTYNHRIRAFFR